jgi:hypothetical protein
MGNPPKDWGAATDAESFEEATPPRRGDDHGAAMPHPLGPT